MIQVNVHEAKSQLSRLIEATLAGEEVTITRAGKPVVDLVVHERSDVRIGLDGWTGYAVDESVCDGLDPQIQELFYGHGA